MSSRFLQSSKSRRSPEMWSCNACVKSFKTKKSLSQHKRSVHRAGKTDSTADAVTKPTIAAAPKDSVHCDPHKNEPIVFRAVTDVLEQYLSGTVTRSVAEDNKDESISASVASHKAKKSNSTPLEGDGRSLLHDLFFENIGRTAGLEVDGDGLMRLITPDTATVRCVGGMTLAHSICRGAGDNKHHDTALVVKLLEHLASCGADLSALDSSDMTPFMMYLSKCGDMRYSTKEDDRISAFFVRDGHSASISPNHRSLNGQRWLNLAIYALDLTTFSYLLDSGADVNSWDGAVKKGDAGAEWEMWKRESPFEDRLVRDGDPPLLVAARRHSASTPFVETLLLNGAHANNVNRWTGRSALHEAAKKGSEGLVHLLLTHGAIINVPDVQGQTPLFAAGHYFVDFMVSVGANTNHQDFRGATAWHCYLHYCRPSALPSDLLGCKALLTSMDQRRSQLHTRDSRGISVHNLIEEKQDLPPHAIEDIFQCDNSAFIL